MVQSEAQPRRSPGPRPRYSHEEIVAAGIALLEREGRDALSIRALAEELGLTAMAIYRYFSDKDKLLDAIVATALSTVATSVSDDGAWGEDLQQAIGELHAALQRSRAIAELVALRRPGRQLDPLRERLLAITRRMGLGEADADETLRTLTSYTFGFTLVEPTSDRHPRHATSAGAFEHGLALIMAGVRATYARAT
jgi:AcrR family transcriptional regulator